MDTTKLIETVCVCVTLIFMFFSLGIYLGDYLARKQIKKLLNNDQCKKCKHFKKCLGTDYKPDNNRKCEYFKKE